jgi:hypothetical protein
MNKYCRICWNTKNWQEPTGEARHLETDVSYVLKHGFGHEEWLFNFAWVLKGYFRGDNTSYKYGYLQPIGKFHNRYQGETFSVLLYTISPEGKRLIIARIDELYVPDEDEAEWVLDQMVENGWLATMRREVEELGVEYDYSALVDPEPLTVTNVRFAQKDVKFFDPRPVVVGEHKILKVHRYHPLNWDEDFPPVSYSPYSIAPPESPDDDEDPTRSEVKRIRSSIKSTIYDPRHVKLQNSLYRKLCQLYGKSAIGYEVNFVDLTVEESNKTTFIEVKTDLTVKSCIRSGLGQLLEYSHYPDLQKAEILLIVGDAKPSEEDKDYLNNIREVYGIPIYYAQWNWATEELEPQL